MQWSLAMAMVTKPRKIINIRLDKRDYQKVYNMNGDEICAVPPTYTQTEVRSTLLRKWNVSGAVTDAIELVPIEGTVRDTASLGNGNHWQFLFNANTFANKIGAFSHFHDHVWEPWMDDYCDSCMSVFGADDKKLEPDDACIFCSPLLCCIRCSHIWRSEPNYTRCGEHIKPGMPICVRCTSPELLNAADEDIPKHYKFVALAWHGLRDVIDNVA